MSRFYVIRSDELYHHGVKGMKWGVRKQRDSTPRHSRPLTEQEKAARKAKLIKAAKIGAVVAGTALITYGGYKLVQARKLPKPFTTEELHAMGIATIEPKRIEIARKRINRINLNQPVRNITQGPSVSGHSERLTRYGAARASATRMHNLMYDSSGKPTPNFAEFEDRYRTSSEEMARLVKANGGRVPKIRPSTSIRRIRR